MITRIEPRRRRLGAALLLVGITLIAYLPVLDAGFIWDDDDYVTHNPVLRTTEGIAQIWFEPTSLPQYYPLVHTTFWLEYRVWGLDPTGYHVVNVLLHALAALALWDVLRRLEVPGAWLGAALFALHPVQVESVAWITERKNVLSMLLALGALRAWVIWRQPGASRPGAMSAKRWMVVGLLFSGALASKTVTCSLPAVMLLLLWWKEGRLARRDLLASLPLFAVGLAAALTTAWLEREHVRAEGVEWNLSLIERVLIAGRAFWFYAGTLVWPQGLVFNYPRWEIDATDPRAWIWPVAALGVPVLLWVKRHRWGRGPLVATLCFGGVLVPALGFFDVYPMRYSFVADHFQYHASAALLALIAAILTCAAQKYGVRVKASLAFSGLVLILLGSLTFRQVGDYRDLETLWRATLDVNPSSWLAHTNLGKILLDRGASAAGIEHLERALDLHGHNAEGHNNLAVGLGRRGELEPAEEHLRCALALDPGYSDAHSNLGYVLIQRGEPAAARRHLETALSLHPHHPGANRNLGTLLADQGRHADALKPLGRALDATPGDAALRACLARSLAALGRHQEALGHLARLVDRDPALRLKAAASLAALGQQDRSLAQVARYLAERPEDHATRARLAQRLADAIQAEPRPDALARLVEVPTPMGDRGPGLLITVARELRDRGDAPKAALVGRQAADRARARGRAADAELWLRDLGLEPEER